MYSLVENDTGIELRVTCTEGIADEATVIDLTDSTVTLFWTSINGNQTRAMTIMDAEAGIASYVFVDQEITAPDMEFELQITNSLGQKRTSLQSFRERVRERL